ncbi:hypothetical protein GUJ93_ZPchr0002g25603 [Zizania palustris]|uniref:ZF-HD dimerization-type domain-containing protein n=1 Tax=Zizania palustris TaxID=103762 RepID=A0A8J5VUS6_ZIZPA|nr:hypothetical protein GUJ93_ZPchr0002g25603 [Zizania palustris]
MEAMDVKYKPLMFPNGAVKKAVKLAAVAPAGAGETVYRECLKNHAASLGGHAVDGCGEFMPSPAANPADPTSLKCAACGCHRNFHRRLAEGSPLPPPLPALPAPPMTASVLHGQPHRGEETPEVRLPGVDGDESDSDSDCSDYDDERSVSPPPPHLPAPVAHQPPPYYPSAPHMLLSLGSSGQVAPGQGQRLPLQVSPATAPPLGGMPRKRFRTKFTAEQKQRMQELSERLGWRLQKRDEAIVDEWCRDIGVGKGVFKVWMHNNKHNYLGGHSARRSASSSAAAAAAAHLQAPGTTGTAPFNPSTTPPHSTNHTSPPPAAVADFNINGTTSAAASATATTVAAPLIATAAHPENGASSPQSA